MEKFGITAMSLDVDLGDAFVLEGVDLYYFINEVSEGLGDFDTVYPCPVAVVAGRFRHNWVENNGDFGPPQESLVRRIKAQQKDPRFQRFFEDQKEHFGKKRFEL